MRIQNHAEKPMGIIIVAANTQKPEMAKIDRFSSRFVYQSMVLQLLAILEIGFIQFLETNVFMKASILERRTEHQFRHQRGGTLFLQAGLETMGKRSSSLMKEDLKPFMRIWMNCLLNQENM